MNKASRDLIRWLGVSEPIHVRDYNIRDYNIREVGASYMRVIRLVRVFQALDLHDPKSRFKTAN